MTFTVSYDLEEEEEEDAEGILQLMIILEVEYREGHLCSTFYPLVLFEVILYLVGLTLIYILL